MRYVTASRDVVSCRAAGRLFERHLLGRERTCDLVAVAPGSMPVGSLARWYRSQTINHRVARGTRGRRR